MRERIARELFYPNVTMDGKMPQQVYRKAAKILTLIREYVEDRENPYPESIFPEMDSVDLKAIAKLLRENGYSMDRLHGSWGRHVWDIRTKAILKGLGE